MVAPKRRSVAACIGGIVGVSGVSGAGARHRQETSIKFDRNGCNKIENTLFKTRI
jgi:hypothetical protein